MLREPSQPARNLARMVCRPALPGPITVAVTPSGSWRRSEKVHPSRRSTSGCSRAASRRIASSREPWTRWYGSAGLVPSLTAAYRWRTWLTDGRCHTMTGGSSKPRVHRKSIEWSGWIPRSRTTIGEAQPPQQLHAAAADVVHLRVRRWPHRALHEHARHVVMCQFERQDRSDRSGPDDQHGCGMRPHVYLRCDDLRGSQRRPPRPACVATGGVRLTRSRGLRVVQAGGGPSCSSMIRVSSTRLLIPRRW